MKTQITRWDPFKELDEFQDRLASFWSRPRFPDDAEDNWAVAKWSPRVDIIEDEREFVVKAELPELKREDVKVTVEDGILTISGERKQEKEEKTRRFHRVEREYGSFLRSFSLPPTAAAAKVSAEFKDGLLRIHLPKDGKAAPKSIEIKSA